MTQDLRGSVLLRRPTLFHQKDMQTKPILVLMAGMPGAGKTTLALALGKELGWPVLDKDTVKTALMEEGVPEQAAGPASYYVPLALCHDLLVHQSLSVILDTPAAYPSVAEKSQVIVQAANGLLKVIWCYANCEIRNQRLAMRPQRLSQLQSDTTTDEEGLSRFAHLPPAALKLNMKQSLRESVLEAMAYIRQEQDR